MGARAIDAINLNTLRQARGCMQRSAGLGERQMAILKLLCDSAHLTLPNMMLAFNCSNGAVSGTLNDLVNRKLIERCGSVGAYRYAITKKGRVLCA
jgi:hypothetical protein